MQNKMKHRFGSIAGKLLAGLLMSAATVGCVRDEMAPLAGRGELRVAFSIDGMEAVTRAVPTDNHERTLKDVHVLFFTKEGNYLTYQHADVPVGSSTFSFKIPEGIVPNTEYRTLVVGNAHSHVPDGYSTFDLYLQQTASNADYEGIQQALYAAINSAHKPGSGNTAGTHVLPMWGQVQDANGNETYLSFSGSAEAGYVVSGTIRFWRSVARFDLRHDAAKELIIHQVKMVNFRKGGYYFHNNMPWAPKDGPELGGINEGTWVDVEAPFSLSGDAKRQEVKASIYPFPNMVPVVVQNDQKTTYLMIAGYYQDGKVNTPDNPKTKLTYYRFNMAPNGGSQFLERNHFYQGVINRVSGPGADTEDKAEDEEAPQLDYTVGDTWEDDDNNTATDENGNYLTISRAMVTFANEADLTETVKVKVKEGLSWSVEWVKDASDASEFGMFSYARNDDGTSFSIRTTQANTSEFVRKARLTVKATGGSVNPAKPLTATVDVMQLSSSDEVAVLMVDNQVGTINYKVPGAGSTLRLQVQTGSARSKWKAEDPNNSTTSITGLSWSLDGGNNGVLEVNVPTNITNGERSFTLKVSRMTKEGALDTTVDPVTLVFVQPKSDYLFTVSPQAPEDQTGLVLEGFDPDPSTTKNGVARYQRFTVTLADPDNYTYSVKSDFNKDYDLFLTKGSADMTATISWTDNSTLKNELTGLVSGESFFVNVFRTGPGDPPITKAITITADPKVAGVGEKQYKTFYVTINTSCTVNDVLIKNGNDYLLVADRNVGASERFNNSSQFAAAWNFTNDTKVHITGIENSDNQYNEWKGQYYPWSDPTGATGELGAGSAGFIAKYWLVDNGGTANTNVDEAGVKSPWYKMADIDKWHVPTKADLDLINARLIFSKERVFIASDEKDVNGKYAGCYFPLAGYGTNLAVVSGFYWSSTFSTNGTNFAYYLSVAPTSSSVTSYTKTFKYSVRPVRTVPADEYNEAVTR